MPPVSRRRFLAQSAAAVAAGAALPARAAAQADAGPVAERVAFAVPGLDPAHDGLRVAQLSDLHVGPRTPVEHVRAAIGLANAFQPDLVALTGDYLCRATSGVGLMKEQLGGIAAPAVAVLGNHDHWVDPRGASGALAAHGYTVLENENTTFRLRGAPFTVVGIGDWWTRNADPLQAVRGAPQGSRITLAHGPKTADALHALGWSTLCLSGHTHGGQINIPGLTSVLLKAFAHEPYDRGRFDVGRVQLYVNRGVGNSGLGIRVNATPEVTLVTLRSPQVLAFSRRSA